MKKNNIYIMYAIALLQGMVFYSSIATLYRQAQGISLLQMSIIESTLAIIVIILEIPWGYICDRIGYKKTLIICNFIYFISKIVFWQADSFFMFLLERILLAIELAGISGCDYGFLYESCKGKKSTHIFGIYQAMGTIGMVFASLMFSFYIQDDYAKAGLWTIYPYALAFLLTLCLKDVKMTQKNALPASIRSLFQSFMKQKHMILFLIASACLTETTHTIYVFYNQLQYQRAGIPIAAMGFIYTCVTIVSLISAASGKLVQYIKEETLCTYLFIGAFFVCLILVFCTNPFLSVVCIALLAVVESLYYPLMNTIENRSIQVAERATMLSLYSMVLNFSSIASNLTFGKSADIGLPYALFAGACFCLLGFILFLCWKHFQRKADA